MIVNHVEKWFLSISTWKGITPWADHYYGLIDINPESEGDRQQIHVKRPMLYKEIINGNKAEGRRIYNGEPTLISSKYNGYR